MIRIETVNLWGEKCVIQISEAKRKPTEPKGYAGLPGTGPAGETCKTCRHKAAPGDTARVYWKCRLMRAHWTGGPGTDIRMRSPACSKWEAREDDGDKA